MPRAVFLYLPDVVKGTFDRRNQTDDGVKEENKSYSDKQASFGHGEVIFGKIECLIDLKRLAGEEVVQPFSHGVAKAESACYADNDGQ